VLPAVAAAQGAEVGQILADLAAAEQACAATIEGLADNAGFTGVPAKSKVGEHTDKTSSVLKIGVIRVGGTHAFTVTEFSDGSVMITFVDTRELGATFGLGGQVALGASGAGAKVELEPGVVVGVGDSWIFPPGQDPAPLLDQLHTYEIRRELELSPDAGVGVALADVIKPLQLPPPTLVASDLEGKLQGSAKIGPETPGTLDPGGSLTLNGSTKTAVAHNTTDGSTITTTTSEDSAALAATLTGRRNTGGVAFGLDGKGTLQETTAVTRDTAGNATKVILTSTHEVAGKLESSPISGAAPADPANPFGPADPGGVSGKAKDSETIARLATTTTTLEVTDANRQIVEQALAHGDVNTPDTVHPDHAVAGQPFQELLHTDATVTDVEYEKTVHKDGIEAEVKEGVTVGVEASVESTDVQATHATRLDRPGPDGVRHPVDFPEGVSPH
jgi:hypothetical protein